MDLVFLCIALGLFVAAYWGVMRYNLHMFQLNGYKNGEHINWLKKNIRQFILLKESNQMELNVNLRNSKYASSNAS